MELRQLRYVLAVVDHGGFTRAAAAEHVAQPSLSQAVRALERELGVELFHRLGRRVSLTPAGEALVGPARQVLRDLATIDAAVADVRGLRAGRLDLVALPTLAVEPLAGLLGRFRHLHPQVSVRVAEPEDLRDLTALVQQGHAELGLTELPPDDPGLRSRPMGSQEILAVRPPGTHRGRARRLAAGDLAGVPLVTTPPGTSTRELVQQALARASTSGSSASRCPTSTATTGSMPARSGTVRRCSRWCWRARAPRSCRDRWPARRPAAARSYSRSTRRSSARSA